MYMPCDWNPHIILNYIIPSADRVCFIPRVALSVTLPIGSLHIQYKYIILIKEMEGIEGGKICYNLQELEQE